MSSTTKPPLRALSSPRSIWTRKRRSLERASHGLYGYSGRFRQPFTGAKRWLDEALSTRVHVPDSPLSDADQPSPLGPASASPAAVGLDDHDGVGVGEYAGGRMV